MSIINSDQYNVDWQLRVLRGLQNMSDQLAAQINATQNVNIIAPLGSQTSDVSVSVAIASDQFAARIKPGIIISSGEVATLIESSVTSISFASNGTANALISFDGGDSYVAIPTGTTINMDAGGIMNRYGTEVFGYDTNTNAGSSLIITYNS